MGEVVLLPGELDQGQDDVVIDRRRQAVLLRRRDGQPADNRLSRRRVEEAILVLDLLKVPGRPTAQYRDRELTYIHFILAPNQKIRDAFGSRRDRTGVWHHRRIQGWIKVATTLLRCCCFSAY